MYSSAAGRLAVRAVTLAQFVTTNLATNTIGFPLPVGYATWHLFQGGMLKRRQDFKCTSFGSCGVRETLNIKGN
jgi:hypothetical protein